MATYIIGIDPAARKLAMWSQTPGGGPPRHKFATLSQDDEVAAHQAFRALCEEFGDLTELAKEAGDNEPKFVVYQEAPIVYGSGSRIGPTISQALVAGGYMAAAGEYYAEHHRVHPSTWKARVVGHGSADKGKIQEYVAETWPRDYQKCFTNRGLVIEDLADARCIMQFGIMNNAMRQAMTKRFPKKKRSKR